jgi:hypothetical protein
MIKTNRNLCCFLTHDFKPVFLETLQKMDAQFTNLDVVVLFDSSAELKLDINHFKHIKIIHTEKTKTSYDTKGHTLYISHFKKNINILKKYNYVWMIENDVYTSGTFKDFIDKHVHINCDVLVSEHGSRDVNWSWTKKLIGFENIYNIGILAVCTRFSSRFLINLVMNIDRKFAGYVEAIVPHLCKKYNYSINTFLPELMGTMNVYGGPVITQIIKNISEHSKPYLIEDDKIYHPIKL